MEGSSTKAKSRRRRTATGAYSGKTKFDKWLELCAEDSAVCEIVLAPPAPYPYTGNADNCRFEVAIVSVDRYNVQLRFLDHEDEDDGGTWWVAKDAIRAASRVA